MQQTMEQMSSASVSLEQVYQTLLASMSPDQDVRGTAENNLLRWEKISAPGYLGYLLDIASKSNDVAEVRFWHLQLTMSEGRFDPASCSLKCRNIDCLRWL